MAEEQYGSFKLFCKQYLKYMSQKKNIDIVFIIQSEERGEKDIDHYLPFFYFLSKSDSINYSAKGIILDSKTNFSQNIDQRFKLLSNLKNVEIEFLYEENFLDKIKKIIILKNDLKLIKFFNKVVNKLFYKLSKFKKKINWQKKLTESFLNSNSPLIFTTNSNSKDFKIVSQIKKQNINAKWTIIPHGTTLCDNQMVIETNLKKNERINFEEIYNEIDYFLITSQRDKDDEVSKGLKESKAIVIGSPRYCKDWKEIKSNLELDGVDVEKNGEYNIRILFLIPKKHINIFSEELVRTIDFISSYKEVELILLSYDDYFPKIPKNIANRTNIKKFLISQKYSTSKLIDWADIVFHAGTGVIFDSFIREKITVLPRYLTCNTLISDNYNAGFNLKNRDELRTLCNSAVKSLNNLKDTYRKQCDVSNKKFIDDFINANSESVPENIKNSILLIGNNFNTFKN